MSAPLAGTLLAGRYRIGGVIGSGGMSVVYEAEDLRLSRVVAVKLLRAEPSESWAERLFREAKGAARANHPAVVTVFAYGTDEELGLDYVVMERLRGEDLAARIARERRLSVEFVTRIAVEIADALAAVHASQVIHRDLKPANIYLANQGRRVDEIKLLDFGLAKHLDLHTLTAPGEVLGTVAYMAPEQIRDPRRVDPRSDIYALGIVLYECLAGTPPYVSKNVSELAHLILQGTPAPLPQGPLAPIVMRCIATRASERFPDARTLAATLTQQS